MSDIVAKLADGTELRFPAGTADNVVNTTVQNYLADPANQVAASTKPQAPVVPTGPEGAPIPPIMKAPEAKPLNWAGTGPEQTLGEYLKSGQAGTFIRGALSSDEGDVAKAKNAVINQYGEEILKDPKAFSQAFHTEYAALKDRNFEAQRQIEKEIKEGKRPEPPGVIESLSAFAKQALEDPVGTAKAMIYDLGKDPEYLVNFGGEAIKIAEEAKKAATIGQKALQAGKGVAKAGAVGAVGSTAEQLGQIGLGERENVDPQEVANQAANFAALHAASDVLIRSAKLAKDQFKKGTTPPGPKVEVGEPTIVQQPELEAYDAEIAKAQEAEKTPPKPTETPVTPESLSHDTQAMLDELSGKEVPLDESQFKEEAPKAVEAPKEEAKPVEAIKEVQPKEEPTGVISETEKEFTPVGGRLINKADVDKLNVESKRALEQNVKEQEVSKETQLKKEAREEKFKEPPTQTLSARLVQEGGIDKAQKSDTVNETGKIEGYNHVFREGGNDLRALITDGKLDDYLPPELRTTATPYEKLYDAEPAYNFISSVMKSGEKVHTYDYEMAKIQHENMVYEKNQAKQQMTPNEAARAAAAEVQGKEYMNVEPSKEVIPTPSETKFHEEAKNYISEVPEWYFTSQTPSFKIEMNKLRRAIQQGKIKQEDVIPEIESIYQATKKERPILDRQRGAAIIKEKLLAAKRRKELSPEMVDMAEWFINQNPDLVKDLAVSIKSNNRDGISGGYLPLSKLAKIFKYSPNNATAVHEILHHTERMMPKDIQESIRKAWSKSLKADAEKAFGGKNEALKQYYRDVIDFHYKNDMEAEARAMKMLGDNAIPHEHYKNFNPSEFWAVKGSDIVQGRFKAEIGDSIVAKIKNWLKEFIEKVKGVFNLSDDAAVIKALDSLAKSDGKFVTDDMIHKGEEAFNLEKPIEHEFNMNEIPKSDQPFTIKAGTEIFHGSHGELANEIMKNGAILKSRNSIKSHGGLTNEGGLIWFADKENAKDWAMSRNDPMHVSSYEKKYGKREPGKVFVAVTNKPLKIMGYNQKLTSAEANKLNTVLEMPDYKQLKAGDSADIAALRSSMHSASPIERYTDAKGQTIDCPWPTILETLGYDGIHHPTGIALNLNEIHASKVIEATDENLTKLEVNKPKEKEYLSISQPPKNFRGQDVMSDWNTPEESKVDDWLYKLQDKHIDAKRVQQLIEKAGDKIEDDWNFYEKEMLYHGRTASGIRKFLLNEVLPAAKEMQKFKVTPEEIHNYLANRHAEERNIQMNKINPATYDAKTNTIEPNPLKDQGSGIHTDAAKKYLADLDPVKKKHLEEIAKYFDKMVKGTQGILMNSGAETGDTIRKWNQTYKHYVPLNRKEDPSSKTQGMIGTGQGYASRGSTSKRALGSLKEHEDILGNLIAQRERAIIRAEKIRVGRALYGLSIQSPNPDFWLPINPDAIRNRKQAVAELTRLGIPDAKLVVDNLMAEPKERYLKKVKQGEGTEPDEDFDFDSGLPVNQSKEVVDSKVNVMARYHDNVFPVRIDGKDRYIFFNKNNPRAMRMAQAIKNLDIEELGTIENIAGHYTRWFKNVNTQYNPVFGLKNFIRDYSAGNLNLTSTPINGAQAQITADMMPAMRGILEVHRNERKGITTANNKWGKFYQMMRDQGFQTGYRDSLIRNQEEMQIINHLLESMNESGVKANAKKAFSYIAGGLTDFNDVMENSIRLAAAKAALDRGLSPQKAAVIAKNITVNFDKKGAKTREIGALYAFFNPAVQGTERIYQTLKGPARNYIIGGGILAGMIQAVMMAAAGYEDNDPPEFTRQKSFVIPMPDGNYFPIPYPQGYNILPNVGRQVMDFIIHGGKNPEKHIMDLTGAIMDSLSPLGTVGWTMQSIAPTALDPLAALEANRDAFDRPIYREDRANAPTPGYKRSRDTVSMLGQGIAKFLNWASGGDEYVKGTRFGKISSPTGDAIDYLGGQIGGGLYREVSKAAQYAKSLVTGEDVPSYRVPIAGQFHGKVGEPAAIANKFYENVTRMTDHENTIKGLRQDKLPTNDYMAKHPEARLWNKANGIEDQINGINKQKRMAIKNNKPKEVIQRLEERKTRIMQKFNDEVKRLNPD